MGRIPRKTGLSLTGLFLAGLVMPTLATAADQGTKTIDLAIHSWQLAAYMTKDGKEECPGGFTVANEPNLRASFASDAARNEFMRKNVQFGTEGISGPETYMLLRGPQGQNVAFFPDVVKDAIPRALVTGKIGYGFNLDGKVGPNDFTSPEGEKGIDNQMYRFFGCDVAWREGGALRPIFSAFVRDQTESRYLIRISGVHDERNDDHVEVTFYKGLDAMPMDGSGKPVPGLIQRVDGLYTKAGTPLSKFTSRTTGRIVDGVLYTDPVDHHFLWSDYAIGERFLRGMRVRLKLTPSGATGLVGGYESVREFYLTFTAKLYDFADSIAYWSPPGFYEALNELADGYPDPKTGRNTALSVAYEVEATRVIIALPSDDTDLEMEIARRTITPGAKLAVHRDASDGSRMSMSGR